MARIASYQKDTSLHEKDKLFGSSYISTNNGTDQFTTGNFTLLDLAEFFANYQISDNQLYSFATISQQVTTNVSDIASNANYSLNLGASFGTVDANGNLTSLSEAFANNLLSVATSEDYATAAQLNSLTATVDNNTASISTNATNITSVTASTTQNTTDIATNTGNISTVTTTANANATAISTLQSGLTTANTNISQNATDITTLDSSVTTINTTITGIQGDITSNTTNITANASAISTLTNNLATTNANVTQNASDVTSLTTTVNTNTTNISTAQGNITTNTTNIATNASDISTLTNNLATANTNISQNASDVTSLTSTVSTHTTDIATNAGNITTNQTNISTNASAITTLQNNLATANANISQNASDVTSLTSTVNSNTSSIGTNTTNIASNASSISTLTNNLATTNANVSQNASDVTSLTTTVNSNTSAIGTNTTNISTNASNITTLQNDLSTAQGDISSNSTNITSLTGTVNGHTGDISTNASNISTLNAGLTTANNNISANSTNITSVTSTANTNTGNISANASSISSLTTTVNGHTTSISTNASSINGIEGRYGVTIDNNGALTGFQLLSGASTSSFVINANDFKIYTGGGNLTPFSVSGSTVLIDGQLNVSGTALISGSSTSGDYIACDFKNAGSSGLSSIRVLNNNNYYGLFRLNTTVSGDIGYYGIDLVIGPASGGGEKRLANFNGGGLSMGLYGTKVFFNDGYAGNTTSTGAGAVYVAGSTDGQATQAMFITVPTNQASSTPALNIETNSSFSIFKVYKDGKTECASIVTSGNIRGNSLTSDTTIVASSSMTSPIYYATNTAYYVDPDGTSNLSRVNINSDMVVGGSGTSDSYFGNYGSGNYYRLHTNNVDTYMDANCGNIYWRQGAATRYYFYMSTANMTINGTLTQNSDIRVKENIVEIPNAIDKIKAMRGVYYNRTDFNTDVTKVGVIAQEVEAVLPEVILEAPDTELKSVAYAELTALLINGIKEQQTYIEGLEARIAALETP